MHIIWKTERQSQGTLKSTVNKYTLAQIFLLTILELIILSTICVSSSVAVSYIGSKLLRSLLEFQTRYTNNNKLTTRRYRPTVGLYHWCFTVSSIFLILVYVTKQVTLKHCRAPHCLHQIIFAIR